MCYNDSMNELKPEVREYFRKIGKKRGDALKEKYGSDYFRKIAAKRKSFGRKPDPNSTSRLGKEFGVTRQRISQILASHGKNFNKEQYADEGMWRRAVINDFFNNKDGTQD